MHPVPSADITANGEMNHYSIVLPIYGENGYGAMKIVTLAPTKVEARDDFGCMVADLEKAIIPTGQIQSGVALPSFSPEQFRNKNPLDVLTQLRLKLHPIACKGVVYERPTDYVVRCNISECGPLAFEPVGYPCIASIAYLTSH
jgi:hypothetical protein